MSAWRQRVRAAYARDVTLAWTVRAIEVDSMKENGGVQLKPLDTYLPDAASSARRLPRGVQSMEEQRIKLQELSFRLGIPLQKGGAL